MRPCRSNNRLEMPGPCGYDQGMMKTLTAKVLNGQLVMTEKTHLPEGTVVQLTVADGGDDLDDEQRRVLHTALADAWTSVLAGDLRPADELISELK